MRKLILVAFSTSALIMASGLARAQNCGCGPTYCTDTPEYQKALAAKKKSLSADHPQRLVALFDKLDRCEAAITTSPGGFSLFRETKNGSITIDSWTAENEAIGAADAASGALKTCRVIIARRAFECCKATAYDKRSDYDKRLDLNTAATTVCVR